MNENKYVKAFLAPRIGRGIYGIGLAIVCIVTAVPKIGRASCRERV